MDEQFKTRFQPQTTYYQQLNEQPIHQLEEQAPAEWQVGDVILDLYEITALLGEGGMGKVFRAHHRGWNLDLAVKCPKAIVFASARGKEDYIREAETWINLGLHPHIASCYYVRSLGGVPRLFAECVEGGSLENWIESRKLYEGGKEKALERMLDIAIQFAWGLGYAHEQGLVHQDVKPHNVLMTPEGVAKVTDFGLARARAVAGEGLTPTGSPLVSAGGYTPAYCSPEQAERRALDHKTDIWSWAVSVLEMFIGGVTWMSGVAAASVLETYLDTGSTDADIPEMPEFLSRLLMNCLEADPAKRPVDMDRLASSLIESFNKITRSKYYRKKPSKTTLSAPSLNNHALSLLDLGNTAGAYASWQKALDTNPLHMETIYNLGLQQMRNDQITRTALLEKLSSAEAPDLIWLPGYFKSQLLLEAEDFSKAQEILDGVSKKSLNVKELQTLSQQAVEARFRGSQRKKCILEGHEDHITSIHLSADGTKLLSGSRDKTLRLWDVSSGRCIRTFKGHSGEVNSVALSHDGRWALSGSQDTTVRLWDIHTGECVQIFRSHTEPVRAVALSPDGKFAASGGGYFSGGHDSTIRLWDVEQGVLVRTFEKHITMITALVFTDDGRLISGGEGSNITSVGGTPIPYSADKMLLVWDYLDGRLFHSLQGHTSIIWSIDVCNSQGTLVTGGMDGVLRLWDYKRGKCLKEFKKTPNDIFSVSISADGRRALVGEETSFPYEIDMKTGEKLRALDVTPFKVNRVCLGEDGKTAIFGGKNEHSNYVMYRYDIGQDPVFRASPYFCQMVTSREQIFISDVYREELALARKDMAEENYPGALEHLLNARDQPGYERSREAFICWQQLSRILPHVDLKEAYVSQTFSGHTGLVSSLCISHDQKFALSGSYDKTMRLWDMASGECIRVFNGHTDSVTAVAMSADGKWTLSTSLDNSMRLWDVDTGNPIQIMTGPRLEARALAMHPGGKLALVGEAKENYLWPWLMCRMQLWDLENGKILKTYKKHTMPIRAISTSSDWRLALSAGPDATLKLWDLKKGKRIKNIKLERMANAIYAAWLSPDGQLAIAGGHAGLGAKTHEIKTWDLQTKKLLEVNKWHSHPIANISGTADGKFAVSADVEGKVLLINTRSKSKTYQFNRENVYQSIFITPDGKYLLAGGGNSKIPDSNDIRLWTLDWELEPVQAADWDEKASWHLKAFLDMKSFGVGRSRKNTKPKLDETDFQELLYALSCAGFGWLRPEGVRRKLEEMTK